MKDKLNFFKTIFEGEHIECPYPDGFCSPEFSSEGCFFEEDQKD
jgi:hypothetical protein